ncbi:hypothetical protein [Hyphomicrobium sp. ghe19]|uniref:hypothetical protein n=1 Tax=Hyphomicrobium sp. ghe19 TaxID=2682968 RepID=UPI001366F940|nr:hypothetical protein HYPP_01475 [Hyphomicrobium sp. ghe19]
MVHSSESLADPTSRSSDLYRKLNGRKISMTLEFIEEGGIARWVADGKIIGTRVNVFMWMSDLDQFKEQVEAQILLLLDVEAEAKAVKERRSKLSLVNLNHASPLAAEEA